MLPPVILTSPQLQHVVNEQNNHRALLVRHPHPGCLLRLNQRPYQRLLNEAAEGLNLPQPPTMTMANASHYLGRPHPAW